MKGTEIIIKQLIEEKVDTIFGYPGGIILPLYDELYRYRTEINHILTANEQGATHAADGYARSTGKVGVVICTSGPGITNTITGIATAYMDSIPLVIITANISPEIKGYDNFQEINSIDITNSITKHNFKIEKIEDLQISIKRAFEIASTGRTGTVLVDISNNLFTEEYEYIKNLETNLNLFKNNYIDEDIDRIVSIINASKKPCILIGGGIVKANSTEEVKKIADIINAPVVTTLMGIDGYPSNEDKNCGLVGSFGNNIANKVILEADLIIGIGTRFSDRTIKDYSKIKAKIIHIDIDKYEINKIVQCDGFAVGNIKEILQKIIAKVNTKKDNSILNKMLKMKNCYEAEEEMKLNPKLILTKLQEIIKNPIIVTDVGRNQILAAQSAKTNLPRHFITSGGFGTMGFGLGAAMGCKIANPNKEVILCTGDGGFNMCMNELSTCKMYDISLTIILINNGSLGMIKELQEKNFNGRFFESDISKRNVDYKKIMETYGFNYFEIIENEEIEKVIKESYMKKSGVKLINCIIK